MAEDIKGLIEANKASKSQMALLEYFDETLEAVTKEKKVSKRAPLHKKMDSMITAFDETRKSFDNNTKVMVQAFGSSVAVMKSTVEGQNQEMGLDATHDFQYNMMAFENKKSSDNDSVIATLESIDHNTLGIVEVLDAQFEAMQAAEDKKLNDPPSGPTTEETKKPKKGGMLDGVTDLFKGFSVFGIPTIMKLGKSLVGMAKGAGKLLGGAAMVVGTVSGVYNGFKAFSDEKKIRELTNNQTGAISSFDKWNTAVAVGIESLTGGLISAKDSFSVVESVLGTMRGAMDYLFDPESGIFASLTNSLMSFIENPSWGGSGDIGAKILESIAGAVDLIWENLIPDMWKNAIKGISGDVGGVINSITGGLFGSNENNKDKAKSLQLDQEAKGKPSMFSGLFGGSSEPALTPEQKVQQNILRRRQMNVGPSSAVPIKGRVDKDPAKKAREVFNEEMKFKRELASNQGGGTVITNNNVSNINETPKMDLFSPSSWALGLG
jgi:hypothetical protein